MRYALTVLSIGLTACATHGSCDYSAASIPCEDASIEFDPHGSLALVSAACSKVDIQYAGNRTITIENPSGYQLLGPGDDSVDVVKHSCRAYPQRPDIKSALADISK